VISELIFSKTHFFIKKSEKSLV